jgi:hypothetical protein
MEDNGLSVQPVTHTLASPSVGWLPTFSRSKTSTSRTRPQIAKAIEDALGKIAVTRFDAPAPIQYAKGTNLVVFSKFMHATSPRENQPTTIFTMADYSRRNRESVAVCLFGSMENYPEYIQGVDPNVNGGWSSSAAPTVFKFIKSHGRNLGTPPFGGTPGEIAADAFQICVSQGGHVRNSRGMHNPWMRGYTYGDAKQAQWLAQVYLDMRREEIEAEGIDLNDYVYNFPVTRILIGAPLWIRTPKPRSVRLYADCDDLEEPIDGEEYEQLDRRVYNPIFPRFKPRAGGRHKSMRRIT